MPGASIALVALAAFCWGVSGGIAGILMADGWGAFVPAFHRGAIGLLFVLVWLALRPRNSGLADRRLWSWAVLAGLGVAGNFAFYFVSIANASVAVSATLMYGAPVWVYLVSVGFKLETSSPSKWAAIVVVLAGIVLLTGVHDTGGDAITPIGVAAGLLSGLCYTAFIFGFGNAARYGSPQAILAIAFTVVVAVLVWPADPARTLAVVGSPDWPLFVVLGVLGGGLSFFCYVVGMRRAAPTLASVVATIEPVTASLFGVAFLGERLSGTQILGMALILVTATFLSVRAKP